MTKTKSSKEKKNDGISDIKNNTSSSNSDIIESSNNISSDTKKVVVAQKNEKQGITIVSGPYINTILETTITLEPNQMNNNIYKNLKQNLIRRLEGKCYRDYGFITKIYEIINMSDGYIVAENPKSAATYKVSFSCKICFPLIQRQIICKIDKSNKLIMRLINGPINVIITMDRINKNIFFIDSKTGNLMAKQKDKSIILTPGMYVKVTLESRTFNDMDSIIMAMGFLDDVASDDEIKESYQNEFNEFDNIKFDDYLNLENLNTTQEVGDLVEEKGEEVESEDIDEEEFDSGDEESEAAESE